MLPKFKDNVAKHGNVLLGEGGELVTFSVTNMEAFVLPSKSMFVT